MAGGSFTFRLPQTGSDPAAVDQALGTAALAGRFGERDLAAIQTHQHGGPIEAGGPATRVSETHSLQPGTAGWAGFGHPTSSGRS